MQCLHQIILYYYNIITSYLLGGLSSDLRWCLHQQLMQCLLSWVAETLLPSSWHAELLSIVRLMRAVFVLPSSSWGVCIPPAWYAELPHCSAHVGCFVLSSSSWGVHHPMASSWHAELPHCSAHVGCSVLPSSSWGVHHPSASWHAESIHSAHDGFVVLPSSSWGVHFLPPHGMLNPSIRLMMALLYLLHFMGGTMSFTASFCYLHGKMMAPVLHRLILLSPWQDGGSFRHLALWYHSTQVYATTTLLTVFSTSCDMATLPDSSCCLSLLHRISTSFIMYVFKSTSESPSSFQP